MDIIISYITSGCTLGGMIIAVIIAIIQKFKKGVLTKEDDLYMRMLLDIENAETMYAPIKSKGIDVSVMKKSYVLSDLQIYANSNGISFNIEDWDKELERMIEFSNKVNNKKGAL